jgi:uncharacterized protein
MLFGEHFEWDEDKEISSLAKHGVSFLEAVAAFADPNRVILPDMAHSNDEPRWHCLGKIGDAILAVRFTERNGRARIIGGLLAERQTAL